MSLSTLLRGSEAIDSELDAFFTTKHITSDSSKPVTPFKKAPTLIPIPGSSKDSTKKKRKSADDANAEGTVPEPKKRAKTSPTKVDVAQPKISKDKKAADEDKKKPKDRKGTKGKAKAKEAEPDDEDDNSDLENAYLVGKTSPEGNAGAMDGSDEEGNAEGPIEHESVTKAKKSARSSKSKTKYVPEGETPELRDKRTIFVGNLSVEVAQQRPLLKQLQRHILSHIPTAKIESTRFRSVPFQAPTSEIPDADTLEGKADPKTTQTKTKTARPHDIDRTSTWRSKEKEKDQEGPGDEKKYLTPNQKKKVAFINQEFHSTADTVHAYIVFAHPVPPESRPKNLPPPSPVLDPYDAAKQAVKTCDGSTFMGRVIRVDLVGKKGLPSVGEDGEGDLEIGTADPKSTVFVGNLDFASKEEDLRAFFEGVVSAERGPPPVDSESEDNAGASKSWVVHVRIVRDKDTQLGKGFAYVQFNNYECVDELLALEPEKLKFAKRKLRVQRCRTLPGASASTRQATASKNTKDAPNTAATKRPAPVVVPKGDPSLGEKLVHLNKEARKQYKSADADRVARRLAKKKARMAMAVSSGVKVQGKERERVRKSTGTGSSGKKKADTGAKKGRARSEKSLAKRNGKK